MLAKSLVKKRQDKESYGMFSKIKYKKPRIAAWFFCFFTIGKTTKHRGGFLLKYRYT
jgi:hypothetical protein